MQHELKTWPGYFEDVISGRKTFEVRVFDRPYRFGDTLKLREWDKMRYFPRPNDWEADQLAIEAAYTGREVVVYVGVMVVEGVTYKGQPAACMSIFLPKAMQQPKVEEWAKDLVKELEAYGERDGRPS